MASIAQVDNDVGPEASKHLQSAPRLPDSDRFLLMRAGHSAVGIALSSPTPQDSAPRGKGQLSGSLVLPSFPTHETGSTPFHVLDFGHDEGAGASFGVSSRVRGSF